MSTKKNTLNNKVPDYKVGDELRFVKGDGQIITAIVKQVFPTAVPSYKLDSDDTPMPLYLSEPVLKKCLENPPQEIKPPDQEMSQ